jgi:hypothetical protein
MKSFFAVLLLAFVAIPAHAASAPLQRDLGRGLAYIRIHALPDDLPPAHTLPGALVLDLRYVRSTGTGVTALGAWLQFHSSPRTPVLVLVNGATAPAVLDFLENSGSLPGLLTLGPPSSRYVPDVALKVPPATERSAYDALEGATMVESLLDDTPVKVRHDEASLAQESATAAAADEGITGDDSAPEIAAPKPPPPLIDVTLQRAVQLHRALVALRRVK